MLNKYDLAQQLAIECVKAKIPNIVADNHGYSDNCSEIARLYDEYFNGFKKALASEGK